MAVKILAVADSHGNSAGLRKFMITHGDLFECGIAFSLCRLE